MENQLINKVYNIINSISNFDKTIVTKLYQYAIDSFKNDKLYHIIRMQKRKNLNLIVINGELNDIKTNSSIGISCQSFNHDGVMAFYSTNTYPVINIEEMDTVIKQIINTSSAYDVKKDKSIFKLPSELNEIKLNYPHPWLKYNNDEIINKVKLASKTTQNINPYLLSVYTVFNTTLNEYIIIRSDGTFSIFDIPYTAIASNITAKSNNQTITVNARLGSSDLSVLFDNNLFNEFLKQSEFYANEAIKLCTAPNIESGHYRLVIDYALAKGLAHEAFGHAAEADSYKSSILWKNGKFLKGEQIAPNFVNIIDEPIFNDYAWQPVGANGNLRKKVEIVKEGKINEALCDIFSESNALVLNTNAERIENFEYCPIPRMTNIRLECSNAIKIDKNFYDITPYDINKILIDNNLLSSECETLLLLGYKGGQVSVLNGDFMFNCTAIYKLNHECKPILYKPAIFSGKTLLALNSIIGAIGPIKTDALGTCGKKGQSVPSSGGANYFIIIDKNDNITIG